MSPENAVPSPSARTPRLSEAMSGRTQPASLMRWHTVTTPMALRVAATAAITNGGVMSSDSAQET